MAGRWADNKRSVVGVLVEGHCSGKSIWWASGARVQPGSSILV